ASRQRQTRVQCRPGVFDDGRDQDGRRVVPAEKIHDLGRATRKSEDRMKRAALIFSLVSCVTLFAAENELTPQEKREGWLLLFDGKTTDGWMNSDRTTPRTPVEDHSLNPHRAGHYMLVHTQQWENFLLSLDFKISKGCNSGIFIRTYSLT